MVKKRDKAASMSASTRTITAQDIKIEDGKFIDENGNIATQIEQYIPDGVDTFKMTIRFEISDEEVCE